MKKSILQFSVIAAIAASMTLTTSCSSEESVAEAYVPEPVQFSVGLGDLSVSRASSRTQASNTGTSLVNSVDGQFASGDYVAIYTVDGDNKKYTKAYTTGTWDGTNNNAPLTAAGTGVTNVFYWKNKNEKKVYEAYSYGTSTAIANNQSDNLDLSANFSVTADQTVATDFKDFLYNFGTVVYPDGSTNLTNKAITLNHQLARIEVRVITDKNYNNGSGGTLTNDKQVYIGKDTENGGICLTGTFTKPVNFTSPYTAQVNDDLNHGSTWDADDYGTWTTVPGTSDANVKQITPRVVSAEAAISGGTYNGKFETTYSAVVIPQTIASGKTMFTINYDGATYIYKPATDIAILPGKKHQFLVVITAASLNVSTVAIQNWTNVAETPAAAVLQ